MRIALDIDGVITEYPDFFRVMSNALKNEEIYIITNRDPATLL